MYWSARRHNGFAIYIHVRCVCVYVCYMMFFGASIILMSPINHFYVRGKSRSTIYVCASFYMRSYTLMAFLCRAVVRTTTLRRKSIYSSLRREPRHRATCPSRRARECAPNCTVLAACKVSRLHPMAKGVVREMSRGCMDLGVCVCVCACQKGGYTHHT